jgi:hypothetical protein
MKAPVPTLPLAVLMAPLLLTLSSCKTIYSDVYSYRKNYFDPYESREAEKSQLEMAKRQAETARLAAMKDAQAQADRLEASGATAPLQLDTGLGSPAAPAGMGGGSSSSIPGLGASPGAPSLGAIPGLDAAPAPAAPAAPAPAAGAPGMMGGGDAAGGAMGGAPAAPAAPKPAAPSLPGL